MQEFCDYQTHMEKYFGVLTFFWAFASRKGGSICFWLHDECVSYLIAPLFSFSSSFKHKL